VAVRQGEKEKKEASHLSTPPGYRGKEGGEKRRGSTARRPRKRNTGLGKRRGGRQEFHLPSEEGGGRAIRLLCHAHETAEPVRKGREGGKGGARPKRLILTSHCCGRRRAGKEKGGGGSLYPNLKQTVGGLRKGGEKALLSRCAGSKKKKEKKEKGFFAYHIH